MICSESSGCLMTAQRSGSADLPLHGGHAPPWLAARTGRVVAKVDSAAVQDGYDLYLHGFIVTADGAWTVVQQGMNPGRKQARRYHWLSEGLTSFVDEPHNGIEGPNAGTIINLTDRRAAPSRAAQLDLLSSLGPDGIIRELPGRTTTPEQPPLPHLQLPAHHEIRTSDVVLRRLHGSLAAATNKCPAEFQDLL